MSIHTITIPQVSPITTEKLFDVEKPQWEKDIEAFRKSNPSISQVIERFPCLAKYRSLFNSIKNHGGQFCHVETVKQSYQKNNEVIKLTSHQNLRCNVRYESIKNVQFLHETGKRGKNGKISGRKSIYPWLYVRCHELEIGEFCDDAFSIGFAPSINYKPVSTYKLQGRELTRDEAIELGGCAFARSTVPLLDENGKKVLDENGKSIRIPTPKFEMSWFTSKVANVLDFIPAK